MNDLIKHAKERWGISKTNNTLSTRLVRMRCLVRPPPSFSQPWQRASEAEERAWPHMHRIQVVGSIKMVDNTNVKWQTEVKRRIELVYAEE